MKFQQISLVFTPGTQLNMYILSIPVTVILGHKLDFSWLATTTDIWNGLSAVILQGKAYG